MVDSNASKGVRARHTLYHAFNNEADELGEDIAAPPVISDILHPRRNISLTAPPSRQSALQNLVGEQKMQRQPTVTSASPPHSRPQLAVHIRSSASSPASHTQYYTQQGSPTINRSQESRPGRIPAATKDKASVILPPAQRVANSPGPQQRKRGRPPKISKPEGSCTGGQEDRLRHARTSEPRRDQPKEAKRRGRPPRVVIDSAREQYLRTNAKFIPFLCEWKLTSGRSCPAELQNMKTLRKHVHVVHGDEDPLTCRWGKCAARDTPIEFADQTEFEEHMERAHFRSFVWHVGEGYQNEGISTLKRDADELPDYLFDEYGNQVTPSIADQQFEDAQQYKERRRKLRRLLIQMDENAPDDEEYMRQTLGLA